MRTCEDVVVWLVGEGTNRAGKKVGSFPFALAAGRGRRGGQQSSSTRTTGERGKSKLKRRRERRVVIKARTRRRRCGGFGIHGGRASKSI